MVARILFGLQSCIDMAYSQYDLLRNFWISTIWLSGYIFLSFYTSFFVKPSNKELTIYGSALFFISLGVFFILLPSRQTLFDDEDDQFLLDYLYL